MRDSHLFKHFWTLLAGFGTVGLWAAGAALAWGMGHPLPVAGHAIAIIGLFAALRAAGELLEREQTVPSTIRSASGLVLAAGFIASAGTGAFALLTLVWGTFGLFGMVPAEAAGLDGASRDVFGPLYPAAATLASAVGLLVAGHGYTHGWRTLRLTEHTVTLRHLPALLDGLRVAHVSDFHLGPLLDRTDLRAVVDRILALDADLICVTGDIVDSRFTDLDAWMPELARLEARHGVYAILGNHDRTSGADRVAAGIRQHTRWHLLRDASACLEIDGARLHLLGLEERPAPDETAALARVAALAPDGEAAILLAHHPWVFPAVVEANVPLTLAGHTHGGQVAVPGFPELNPARLLMTPYWAGWYEERGCRLHVSRGLGTSGQRLRIAAPREITVVTLRAPSA